MHDGLWERLLTALDGRLPPQVLDTWIRPGRLIGFRDNRLEIGVPNKFVRAYIVEHYLPDLQAAAHPKRSGLQGDVLEREIEDVLRTHREVREHVEHLRLELHHAPAPAQLVELAVDLAVAEGQDHGGERSARAVAVVPRKRDARGARPGARRRPHVPPGGVDERRRTSALYARRFRDRVPVPLPHVCLTVRSRPTDRM